MIERKYNLLKILEKSSMLILGPRGSGKSFYVNHELDTNYPNQTIKINLLSADDYNTYLNHPELLARIIHEHGAERV